MMLLSFGLSNKIKTFRRWWFQTKYLYSTWVPSMTIPGKNYEIDYKFKTITTSMNIKICNISIVQCMAVTYHMCRSIVCIFNVK